MSRIVLASGSPRRQELLNRIGITDFDIRVPQTDEHYPAGLTPAQIVEYISREKADAAAKLCTPEEIVITADTMVSAGMTISSSSDGTAWDFSRLIYDTISGGVSPWGYHSST